jgi:hypothetical protein
MPMPVDAITDSASANAITLAHPPPPTTWATKTSAEEECACSLAGDATPCMATCGTAYRMMSSATANTAARPGLTRRCVTSSFT